MMKNPLLFVMVLGVSPILLMVSGIKKTREIQILENNNKSQKIKSKHENWLVEGKTMKKKKNPKTDTIKGTSETCK